MKFTFSIFSMLLSALLVQAQPRTRAPERIAFLHATLIDGTGAPQIQDAMVVIEGDRIVTAAKMLPEMNFPAHTKRVDMRGKYIMPGIIDSHIHYEQPRDLRQMLAWGVTSANCMFETNTQAKELYDLTNSDTILAPQIYPTVPIFTNEHGWWSGEGFPVDSLVNRFPRTSEDARAQVDKLTFTHIKLMYDDMGWCRDPLPRFTRMDSSVMQALIDEGHKRKFFSEVHAPQYADAKQMLGAGVNAFAHGILDKPLDADFISTMKRNGTMYVPTFCVFEFLADTKEFMNIALGDARIDSSLPADLRVRYRSNEYFEHYEKTYPNIKFVKSHLKILRRNMKALADSGITIPMGTDMWAFPGIGAHLELAYMVKAGMTPAQAIVSCTRDGAKFLKQDDIGFIGSGMRADMLILNSDPTKDIHNTRDIYQVIKRGVIFDRNDLIQKAKQ